jgi:hypothetical protein
MQIGLTSRGEAGQQAALTLSRQMEQEMVELIGAAEMGQLRHLLERLTLRLKEKE